MACCCFGGKSKRGKSWLIFDLAIALAVGRAGFRHFPCPAPMPVLYLALEDGRARLQSRAKAIQPNLTTANDFHLRYSFPPLVQGGIEALHAEISRYRYGLVIIDVLAKLETSAAGKSERGYHDVYDMFTPLQELRKQHPFCLAMLTHLRKQEADDVFDALLGSVAYQGAQDVLWVLERKPKDDYAFLHIRDKDAEEKTIALRFIDGHWQYIGEGEEYEVSRDQRKIVKILADEKREMGIDEIRKAANWKEDKYHYIRNMLVAMVKDDMIHRTKYGKYSATIRATQEMMPESDDNDTVPF
jgi:RecA-family ATPase